MCCTYSVAQVSRALSHQICKVALQTPMYSPEVLELHPAVQICRMRNWFFEQNYYEHSFVLGFFEQNYYEHSFVLILRTPAETA